MKLFDFSRSLIFNLSSWRKPGSRGRKDRSCGVSRMTMKGFSLIELLCAITIGLIVIGMTTPFIVHIKKTLDTTNQTANQHNSFRFASQFLKIQLAKAGWMGNGYINRDDIIHDYGVDPIHQITPKNIIKICRDVACNISNIKPKINSDIIITRQLSNRTLHPLLPFQKNQQIIVNGLKPRFKEGDDIAIADQQHVALLKVVSVTRSPKNQTQTLYFDQKIPESFDTTAYVGKLQTIIFFITPSNQLMMKIIGERAAAITDGITDLNTQAILLNNDHHIIFQNPSAITDWSKVKGIILLLGSPLKIIINLKKSK